MRMTLVAGADGCPAGWISIARNVSTGELRSDCFGTAGEMIRQRDAPRVLGIDVPIGLTQRGKRSCDVEARRKLGRPRSSSVFPPPVRGVLAELSPNTTREQASELHRRIDGRGIGAQAWGIVRKIEEVDDVLASRADLQSRVREVHPEVSFCVWAGRPMRFRKKNRMGRDERRSLIDDHFGREAFGSVRAEYRAKEVGDDDILDAFAVLWTAERVFRGQHGTLPEDPPLDAVGLRMEIVY